MQSPRLTCLRQATASIHGELEQLVEARRFFETLPGYRTYLQRMHRFYRQYAEHRGPAEPDLAGLSPAADRIGWLEADLADLGITPLVQLPRAGDARDGDVNDARSHCLGGLYVICGASLGARLLVQKTALLDLPGGLGRTYFTNVAAAKDWKRYLEALERTPGINNGALQAGAIGTFGDIRSHLCERP